MKKRIIAALIREREVTARRAARLDRMISRASALYSPKAGYRVNLRPDQLRREVSAEMTGAPAA